MRKLTISFGGRHHAEVTEVRHLDWAQLCGWLVKEPPETETKEDRGWYCGAEFTEDYRHSDNYVARHVITLDFDHVDVFAYDAIVEQFKGFAHALYTTFSHTEEKHRFRLVLPLSRPAGYDEFQAVARRVAEKIGIELVARESFVPCQFMFAPCRPVGGTHRADWNVSGMWIDVDATLATYEDWTDRASWPVRKDGDRPTDLETKVSPLDKPGIVGAFCRAFPISKAIERFKLPYVQTAVEGRWTYTQGSRPEGAIVYDDDTKLHSHHDTDPARGQNNAFDLVRAHRYNAAADDLSVPVTERASYRAMCKLAQEQPELQLATASEDFEDLGPLNLDDFQPLTEEQSLGDTPKQGADALARRIADVLRDPTQPRWLIRDELELGVIAVMAGPRGSYKSFIALDWAMRCATNTNMGHAVSAERPVYVVSAEGGDFDRRARAWLQHFRPDLRYEDIPLFVVERRLDLNSKEGIEAIREDCKRLGIRPVLFVLDTFSKLSGGLDENDNTEVKQFIGRLDNGLKRKETAFDATVLLVCHTGHSDAGRPRGASALAADTDAEYIVHRAEGKQLVSVTRERFKASPELPPLSYRAEVVRLGYHDIDGNEITSLVMLATDPPKAKGPRSRPQGMWQELVYQTMQKIASGNGLVSALVLTNAVLDKIPFDPEKRSDARRTNVHNAMTNLISKQLLFMHPNNMVAMHDVQVGTEEAWLQ